MSRIPYHRQPDDFSCGPTSLRMTLASFRKNVPMTALVRAVGLRKDGWTTNEALVRAARAFGLRVRAGSRMTFAELASGLALGRTIIVNYIEPDGEEGHFAVLTRFTKTTVTLHDPWNGPDFRLARKDFERRWRSGFGRGRRWAAVMWVSGDNVARKAKAPLQ